MRTVKVAIVLQIIAATLFVLSYYEIGTYGLRLFHESGRHIGQVKLQETIRERGIDLPRDILVHADKRQFLSPGLSVWFVTLTRFVPALVLQLAALIALVVFVIRERRKDKARQAGTVDQ